MAAGPVLVVGVDPSSSATGIVLLRVPDAAALRLEVDVLRRRTVRPGGIPLEQRLVVIERAVRELLGSWLLGTAADVAIEDPTDYPYAAARRDRNAGGAAGKVGAAFAAAYLGAARAIAIEQGAERGAWRLRVVPSQTWIPLTRTRNRPHPMPHDRARALLRAYWPALEACTDDETFAAGVALFALSGRRLAAR